jgi:hypothetical protein
MIDDAAARERLLQTIYAAFNARDLDAALATMQPEVVWPNGMEGGYINGRDGVREYWSRQWGLIDPSVEPLRFTHGVGEVVVDVKQLVRDLSGAVVVDAIVRHAYRFENGLIQSMEIRGPAGPGK